MTTNNPVPPPPSEPRPPIDWLSLLRRVARALGAFLRFLIDEGESPLADVCAELDKLHPCRIVWALGVLAVFGYLGSGLYVVAPGEFAVVRRFGAVMELRVRSGLHYRLDRVFICTKPFGQLH